jgi:hypothetical protein
VVLSRAAYRKFGASRSFFARCGIPQASPQACAGSHRTTRVPHVRPGVRGPKTMGEALHSLSFRTLPFVISTEAYPERSGEISVWMLFLGNVLTVRAGRLTDRERTPQHHRASAFFACKCSRPQRSLATFALAPAASLCIISSQSTAMFELTPLRPATSHFDLSPVLIESGIHSPGWGCGGKKKHTPLTNGADSEHPIHVAQ